MSVYVVSGISKGIGFEIARQLSEDEKNLIIGLVRDKAATEKKIAAEIPGRTNIHVLHGDLTDYASLKQAAADTTKILGDRGVDYLIANAAMVSYMDAYDPIGALADKPSEIDDTMNQLMQTNVTGNIHLFNLFMPLVLKGNVKKIIAISSGHADLSLINDTGVEVSALYSASKAALNVIVAKFSLQYKKDGVLIFSMSPGAVDVGHFDNVPPEKMEGLKGFMDRLLEYAPHFKGPTPVDEAVRTMRATWDRVSIEGGFAGVFVSQHGNQQWV